MKRQKMCPICEGPMASPPWCKGCWISWHALRRRQLALGRVVAGKVPSRAIAEWASKRARAAAKRGGK